MVGWFIYKWVFHFKQILSQSPHEAAKMLIQWVSEFHEPPIWVGYFGCSCFDFSFLWIYSFVHVIKQIQLFSRFVDTFFVWPRIPFVVATPQLDLDVEQPSKQV